MPKRPVILAFDDGYSSFYDRVWPLCSARKMTGTVFLLGNGIGGTNHWDAHYGAPSVPLMDQQQVARVLEGGMELGVHGWNHRRLMESTDVEIREEIITAKEVLEERFGQKQTTFCYSYGKFAPRLFPILREAGYLGAVAIHSPWVKTTDELFAMRRINIQEKDHGHRFLIKLSSPYLTYLGLRQRSPDQRS